MIVQGTRGRRCRKRPRNLVLRPAASAPARGRRQIARRSLRPVFYTASVLMGWAGRRCAAGLARRRGRRMGILAREAGRTLLRRRGRACWHERRRVWLPALGRRRVPGGCIGRRRHAVRRMRIAGSGIALRRRAVRRGLWLRGRRGVWWGRAGAWRARRTGWILGGLVRRVGWVAVLRGDVLRVLEEVAAVRGHGWGERRASRDWELCRRTGLSRA